VWTETSGATTVIHASRYDPTANSGAGGWVALPNVSTGTSADNARIVNLAGGPVVTWLDSTSGATKIFAAQYNGSVWNAFGTNGTSGTGVSASATSVSDNALTTDGTNVAVSWTNVVAGVKQIFVAQSSGGAWTQIGGANGASNTPGDSQSPSLAYLSGTLYVAWQSVTPSGTEIYVAARSGGSWIAAGAGSNSGAGVSNTHGGSTSPQLSTGGGQMFLAWIDDRTISVSGNTVALYARKCPVIRPEPASTFRRLRLARPC
jgi:hypothetical protein